MIPTRRASSPFLTGLFVLVGLGVLAALVIWLGASKFFREYNVYNTYFNSSVQGLDPGQPVKYQGVNIGNIKALRVAPDGKLIEVEFRLDKKIQVSDSMRIRIEMASIAGSKYLLLFYPDAKHAHGGFPDISGLSPEHPVIPSAQSSIEEIRESLNEAINNVLAIDSRGISAESVRALRAVAQAMENPELAQTVHNLNRTTQGVSRIVNAADTARLVQDIDRVVADAATTGKSMVEISQSLLATSQKLESIATKLDQDISKLDISRRADEVVRRYDTTMLNLSTTITGVGRRTEMSLSDARALVQELKAASRDFRRAVRAINDNPGQLLLAEPPPKEK
jgi:phospholipid/cholesterol/gamma-HCH transport system substrate-binding protein